MPEGKGGKWDEGEEQTTRSKRKGGFGDKISPSFNCHVTVESLVFIYRGKRYAMSLVTLVERR